MKDWVDNEGKALIESLNAVLKETRCVIDLEQEADTIICTCGHQCINHANITSDLALPSLSFSNCRICSSRWYCDVRIPILNHGKEILDRLGAKRFEMYL